MTHRTYDEWRVHGRTVRKHGKSCGKVRLPSGTELPVYNEDQTEPFEMIDTSVLPLLTPAERRESRNAKRRKPKRTVKMDWQKGTVGGYTGPCVTYHVGNNASLIAAMKKEGARFIRKTGRWYVKAPTQDEALTRLDKMRANGNYEVELGPELTGLDDARHLAVVVPLPKTDGEVDSNTTTLVLGGYKITQADVLSVAPAELDLTDEDLVMDVTAAVTETLPPDCSKVFADGQWWRGCVLVGGDAHSHPDLIAFVDRVLHDKVAA
jgi:hypothetical protein